VTVVTEPTTQHHLRHQLYRIARGRVAQEVSPLSPRYAAAVRAEFARLVARLRLEEQA
jgi:hypothetical protein